MTKFDFSTIPNLETDRLLLRRIVSSDTQDWLNILSSDAVTRYLVDIEEANLAEITDIIQWTDAIITEKTGIRWAISLVIIGLVISGLTAFPLLTELNLMSGWVANDGDLNPAHYEGMGAGYIELAFREADKVTGRVCAAGLHRPRHRQSRISRSRVTGIFSIERRDLPACCIRLLVHRVGLRHLPSGP